MSGRSAPPSVVATARPRGVALALLLAGCASAPPARGPSTPAPLTDATACPRLCARLEGCGGAPARCQGDCERDRARLRDGFSPSFVGCVERELGPAACGPPANLDARGGAIAMCWAATLEVWAERDRGASLRRVMGAACRKRARCAVNATFDEGQCVAELETRATAAGKLLAAARPALVEAVARCVESSACDDEASAARCVTPPSDGALPR